MKKIKYSLALHKHVGTSKPIKDYVVRFERIPGSLIVRVFKLVSSELFTGSVSDIPVAPIVELDSGLLRKIVREKTVFHAKAVTSDKSALAKYAHEIGRYVFSPEIVEGLECGAGERNDFAAFVFGMNTLGELDEPYNWFVQSTAVKGSLPRTSRLRNSQPILVLYSDKARAPIDEWTLMYVDSIPFILEDTTTGVFEDCASDFIVNSLLPKIEATSNATVSSNDFIDVAVTVKRKDVLVDYSGELVVEAISGYVPNTRVSIFNGQGVFKAMALGLVSGDTLRVKVGSKNISGLADISIPVV